MKTIYDFNEKEVIANAAQHLTEKEIEKYINTNMVSIWTVKEFLTEEEEFIDAYLEAHDLSMEEFEQKLISGEKIERWDELVSGTYNDCDYVIEFYN